MYFTFPVDRNHCVRARPSTLAMATIILVSGSSNRQLLPLTLFHASAASQTNASAVKTKNRRHRYIAGDIFQIVTKRIKQHYDNHNEPGYVLNIDSSSLHQQRKLLSFQFL